MHDLIHTCFDNIFDRRIGHDATSARLMLASMKDVDSNLKANNVIHFVVQRPLLAYIYVHKLHSHVIVE